MEDLQKASELLVKALKIRQRYMAVSKQSFPPVCQRFLKSLEGGPDSKLKNGIVRGSTKAERQTMEGM